MVTHIGGLDAAAETLNLPKIPGGKKLIYPDRAAYRLLTDLRARARKDAQFTALAIVWTAHNGLWCPEAEEYLLKLFSSTMVEETTDGTTPQSQSSNWSTEREA